MRRRSLISFIDARAAAKKTMKKSARERARTRNRYGTIRAHKEPGGIMHGGRSVNFGTQNSVSGLLRGVAQPLQARARARSDKSECIYIKEPRLRHEGRGRKGERGREEPREKGASA